MPRTLLELSFPFIVRQMAIKAFNTSICHYNISLTIAYDF